MNQGAACMHNGLHSAARNWVVQLFDAARPSRGPCCTVSPAMFLGDTDVRSVSLQMKSRSGDTDTDKRSAPGKRKVAGSHSKAGSGLLGSVCMSCVVIPSNWLSLHPTLPYQGMARGGKQTMVVDGMLW